jgi:hypothetical protein
MRKKQKPESCDKENAGEETVEQDQKERPYYYDDSHGYEPFDPTTEEDDEDKEAS